jgi:hypothetical protein
MLHDCVHILIVHLHRLVARCGARTARTTIETGVPLKLVTRLTYAILVDHLKLLADLPSWGSALLIHTCPWIRLQ